MAKFDPSITKVPFLIITGGAGHYFQLPSLTTTQRDALTAVNGMTIYNSTTNDVETYENGSWVGTIGTKYTDAEAKAAAVQAGTITNAVTKAPTHDAVYDVKVTADAALPAASKYTDAEAVDAVEAAGLDLAANKGVDLEETLGTDHTYSGITCAGVAGEELVFGKLIYLDDTNHRWWKCQADDEDTHGAKRLLGMMVTDDTIAAAGAILVLLLGFITDTGFSLSDFGAPIFISAATAGAITETAPTGTTGFIVRIIGHTHDDANTFFFNPDAAYVELA